jgi:thiamine biosynthesis protein ThiS
MIRVNRRHEIEWSEGLTVADLLERMNYTFPHIVVFINEEVIPHERYATETIPDGADVQVLHLIAGG